LLDDLLRKRWGWPGFVVSDYQGVRELRTLHGVAATDADAAFQALEAGVDIELPDRNLYKTLLEPFKRGELPLAPLDRAVARVLRAKFLLGLFENPYVDPDLAEQTSARPEHRELARVAAQRSIVLLKNAGNLLPLDRAKLKSLAVIGPNAERCALGGYSSVPTTCTGILAGIRAKVGAAIAVHHAEGCGITKENERRSRKVVPYTAAEDARLIADAVALAKRSDAAIVVVGDNEQTAREASGGGHFGDRGILDLFGRQDELVRAIVATGRPTVVVLINGRPPSINAIAETVPAILEGFYLGQEGGHAVADVLFGDANPGGKVPISFARSGAHAPVFYNHKPSARRGYFEEDGRPLFVFGHGLSYTTFARANLAVNPPRVGVGESVSVEVDVTNTGKVAGDEVVQVYVRDVVSSVTRPVKELKGFARVTLAPGETRRVALPIGPAELGFLDRDMKFVVEPGTFEIMVGGNSVNTDKATFEVVGAAAGALKDSRRRSAARRTGNTSDRSLR
jgi:beta-glucosidase